MCRSGGRGAAVGGEQGGEHLESCARTSRSRNVTLKQFLRVFVSRGGGSVSRWWTGAAVGGEQGGEHLESRARTSRSRNVTLKQFLRVFVSRGECVAVVDGGLPWEVNKEESIWSLVPGRHVHVMSLLNSSYGSSFRGGGGVCRSGGRGAAVGGERGAAVGGEQGGEHLEARARTSRSRNVTLKQFLRVFVSRGGECVAVVDRGLPWEVNKEESIWSLVPGRHVHVMSLLNSSYGSSFRGRGEGGSVSQWWTGGCRGR